MKNSKLIDRIIKLEAKINKLECKHILRDRIFTNQDSIIYNQICSKCGKIIESYATVQDFTKASNKFKRTISKSMSKLNEK